MKQLLLRRKITRQVFNWPFGLNTTKGYLLAAYQAEVEYRGRDFVLDDGVKKNLTNIANALTGNRRCGLLLCGKCGNGKTTTMYAFQNLLNHLSDAGAFQERTGISIYDAVDLAHMAKNIDSFRKVKEYPMLGVEDMGREPREVLDYGNVYNPIIELLEYRYVHQLYTVITTNLTPKQITESYGQRIGDRLKELVDIIVYENGTYRG